MPTKDKPASGTRSGLDAPGAGDDPLAGQARFDAFVTYRRLPADTAFVDQLQKDLAERRKQVWVDRAEIEPAADWEKRITRGINAAKAYIFVMTPDSVISEQCLDELGKATERHKLIIPVVLKEVDRQRLPESLSRPNWISFSPGQDAGQALGKLIVALEDDLPWRDQHTRLAGRANDWEDSRQDRSFLLRGRDLREAEDWRRQASLHVKTPPTDLQIKYIRDSRTAARRRQSLIGSGTAAALAVALVLSLMFLAQRSNAQHQGSAAAVARSGRLAVEAVSQAAADPEHALSAALQAFTASPTPVAEATLRLVASEAVPEDIFSADQTSINAAQFSPDGRLIVTAGYDGTVKVWRVGDYGKPLDVFRGSDQGAAEAASFDHAGLHVVSAGDDGTVRVWDLRHPRSAPLVFHAGQQIVYDASFAPDGRYVAAACADGTVRVWDLAHPQAAPTVFRGPQGAVQSVAFAPDSNYLVSAGEDATVRVWDLAHPQAAPTVLRGHTAPLWATGFSPDGQLVISAGEDHTVRIWDWRHPAAPPIVLTAPGDVYAAAFAPDGFHVVAAGNFDGIWIWDLRDLDAGPLQLHGQGQPVYAVGFDNSGQRLLSAGGDDTVRLWSWAANSPLAVREDHPGAVYAAAFQPGGTEIATAGGDGIVRVWNGYLADSPPALLNTHDRSVYAVAFAPDGHHLAAGGPDGIVRVWNLRNPKSPPAQLRTDGSAIEAVSFSPNGHQLAAASRDGSVRVWSWNNLRAPPLVLHSNHGWAMTVALTDGRRVVSGADDGAVLTWTERAHARPSLFPGHNYPVLAVGFTPDGSHVLSVGLDGILVWDVRHPAAPVSLARGPGYVLAAALSPDGQHIATINSNGLVEIWDWLAPSVPPIVLDGLQSMATAVAFAPDGQHVIAAGVDGTLHVWDCLACGPIQKVVSLAQSRLPR
jgi:WD40 repeat protein